MIGCTVYMYEHVHMYTHSNISTSELIILFLSHDNTAKGAERDGENTNT